MDYHFMLELQIKARKLKQTNKPGIVEKAAEEKKREEAW